MYDYYYYFNPWYDDGDGGQAHITISHPKRSYHNPTLVKFPSVSGEVWDGGFNLQPQGGITTRGWQLRIAVKWLRPHLQE